MNESLPLSLAERYQDALACLDKFSCVQITLDALAKQEVTLIELYRDILARALNDLSDAELGGNGAIWHEHVRSEITRTVIECCYPMVQAEAKARAKARAAMGLPDSAMKRVMIVLPADEQHELGARMGADFFQIAGFATQFVGANTPSASVLEGIAMFKPDYIDLHVVNYYNLFKASELLKLIQRNDPTIRILASGRAFYREKDHLDRFAPVCLVRSFEDIESLLEDGP